MVCKRCDDIWNYVRLPIFPLAQSANQDIRYGPCELAPTGNLRNWTSIPNLNKIKAPTLLINGAEDEAQDVAMQPFFDHIGKAKWIVMDNAAHFCHVDQREKFMEHLRNFLVDE